MTPEQFAQFKIFNDNLEMVVKIIISILMPFFVWNIVYASDGLWDKFLSELSIATAKAKFKWWMPLYWFVITSNIIYWIFTV